MAAASFSLAVVMPIARRYTFQPLPVAAIGNEIMYGIKNADLGFQTTAIRKNEFTFELN